MVSWKAKVFYLPTTQIKQKRYEIKRLSPLYLTKKKRMPLINGR